MYEKHCGDESYAESSEYNNITLVCIWCKVVWFQKRGIYFGGIK